MTDKQSQHCPLCEFSPMKAGPIQDGRDGWAFDCPNCGAFEFCGSVVRSTNLLKQDDHPVRLSHAIRKIQGAAKPPFLGTADISRLIENTPLPKPQEQADNLVLSLGGKPRGLREYTPYAPDRMRALVGARSRANVTGIIDALETEGLVAVEKCTAFPEGKGLALTMKGWARYQQLEHATLESRKAFMAMKYRDELLDRVYRECFQPSVRATGFELFRLDEQPKAGIIDNRMRVAIRTARFLIADLTHNNLGAYWEAGFAEGLGRPVIYTCERAHFAETHFDTNHSHTVLWSETDLAQAGRDLTTTIRATLPTEATLEGE